MKATAIIPAHNEGLRIGRVLKQVTTHPLIAHTIVVDDGSSDQTVEEARKYAVSIISIPYTGKGGALARGVSEAGSPILFFCDADIVNLTHEDITRVVRPVLESAAGMCIGARASKTRRCGPLSWNPLLDGQRAVHRQVWDAVPNFLKRGYMIEVALNTMARRSGIPVHIEYLALSQCTKEEKYGFARGRLSRLGMLAQVFVSHLLSRCIPLKRVSESERRFLGRVES
jgi:glycosyltransferase involved in cell wall biosynthesis